MRKKKSIKSNTGLDNSITNADTSKSKLVKYRDVKANMNRFLIAYKSSLWNMSEACKLASISSSTVRRWLNEYPVFKEAMQQVEEDIKDFAESRLFDFMNQNNKMGMVTTIFFLKTKCQDRGYIEKQQIEATLHPQYSKETIDAVVNAAIKAGVPVKMSGEKIMVETQPPKRIEDVDVNNIEEGIIDYDIIAATGSAKTS